TPEILSASQWFVKTTCTESRGSRKQHRCMTPRSITPQPYVAAARELRAQRIDAHERRSDGSGKSGANDLIQRDFSFVVARAFQAGGVARRKSDPAVPVVGLEPQRCAITVEPATGDAQFSTNAAPPRKFHPEAALARHESGAARFEHDHAGVPERRRQLLVAEVASRFL